MNIEDALEQTGKAIPIHDDCGGYVMITGEELYWFNHGTNTRTFRVSIQAIMNTHWLPYVEVEEIVPMNTGELWVKEGVHYMTVQYDGNLTFISKFSAESLFNKAIHGRDGWTREYPHVEESMKEYADRILKNMEVEPEFPFYVKITGCSGEHFWYKDNIGTYYKVVGRELTESTDKQYKIDDGVSLIRLDDCVIVELQEKCQKPHP